MAEKARNPYRLLPSVEETLGSPELEHLLDENPRELLVAFVQETLGLWRGEIEAGALDADGVGERVARGELARAVEERVRREEGSGVRRAVNATGVVLHTGLGRAPVHPEAAEAMRRAAQGFCVLEVDRFTGQRNRRDQRLSELLCRLCDAEAGIAVNNNAAAVLLLLNTFAGGRETIVSRGELVEIGGSFRMPEIMKRAGTELVEVGTTNRTRPEDFRSAAGPGTGLLLKVHGSNFAMVGFTEEVSPGELATLGTELSITTAFDLGSGLLEGEGSVPEEILAIEPRVSAAVNAGVDVVCFSGDKLLGGPQAGLIVGSADAVLAMRDNPMYRALRLDKVAIAGLERTLELLLDGRGAELPARALLRAGKDALKILAERIAERVAGAPGLSAAVRADRSQPGSGSAPGVYLDTWVVALRHEYLSADALAGRLRAEEPPVFARIQEDELLLDPRTLLPGDDERLIRAVQRAAGGRSR